MKGKHRSDFWAACPLLVLFLSLMGAAEVLASSIIGRIAVIHAYSQMFKSDRAEAMRLGGRGSGEKTGEELWSMTPVPMLGDRGPASPVYKRRLSVGNSPACDQPLPEDDSRGRRVCTELIARVLTNLPVESNTTSFGSSEQDPLRALQNAFGIAIKDRMEGESETTRLHHQVAELSVKGQYDEALRLAEQALQMSAKDSRNRLEKLVIALNNLGQLCAAKGDYDQVERLYERALDFNRHKGVDDEMATTLDNLGELYRVKGDYANAETYLQKALREKERFGGAQPGSIALTLNHIALLSLDKGDYSSAESSLERALDIYRQVPPSENAGLATTLNTLGALYRGQGDYDRAEASLKEALKIDEQTLGTGHPEVAATLNNLAELFHDKGDYGEAERLYEQARQVWERALGAQHPRIATVLNNLAVLYQDKGDYTRAQSQLQKALALRIKNVGRVHPQVGILFNNLGGLYRAQGDLNCAAQLYEQAREIWERTLGPEHPHVITLLNNLAGLYRVQGNESAALSRLQRVLDYREKVLGSMHPDVGTTLNNLAELYRIKGAYEQAEPHYTRASELKAQGLARKHPHVATIQHNLALLYQAKGEVKKAVAAMTDSAEIREHNLTVVLGTGSEEQRRSYTATLAGETNSAVSLHARVAPYDVQARDLALTTILRRKGRVLDAMANDRGILRRHLDPQAQDLLEALSAVYTQLSTVIHRGPTAPPAEQYNAEVARLEEQADQLERALSARSAAFRAQSQPVTLNTVQAAISEGAVLVEFLWYTPVHPEAQTALERWGEARYVAYVLRQTGAPTWIDLGEAAAIDQAVSRLRDALGDPARTDVQSLARALDEQVMRPLRPLLGDSHLVLVSPDGVLNLIPFTALVDEEHHYLVERFTFTYLTSGRDLLRLQVGARSRSGPVILASPNCYLDVTGSHLSQQRWLPLPGTLEEADALKGLLPGAVTLTWQEATEEALKGIQGPRILHTATHGFFLSDSAIENPLLRSGLVLAGANGRTSRQEDGLATARELSELDLWGTQLVVLSACETGVGEVHSGEGVYGLRRALVLAGAEAQVMSLWKVSDAATRDLMVAYYRSLISDGEGRAAALRHVQRTMWRSGDRAHPFYWASFIHSGQWTPLSDEGREGGPSSVVSPEPGKP